MSTGLKDESRKSPLNRLDKGQRLACSLSDEEFALRRNEARQKILKAVKSARRVKNGVEITFKNSNTIRRDIEAFVELEKECCSFLDFASSIRGDRKDEFILLISGAPESAATVEIFVQAINGVIPVKN